MVYSGGETRLVADTIAAGGRAADGLPMLLHQGAISFEHWFHMPPDIEAMRRGLLGGDPT